MSDRIATVACVEASGFFQFSRKSDFFFFFSSVVGLLGSACIWCQTCGVNGIVQLDCGKAILTYVHIHHASNSVSAIGGGALISIHPFNPDEGNGRLMKGFDLIE